MRRPFDTPEAEQFRELERAGECRPGSSVRPKVEAYRGRVLVVDDSEDARNCLSAILRVEGFDVLVARDGEEGLACYRALHRAVDAVVLDMQMPGMDGAETLRQLQLVNPSVRAILCSGGASNDRIELAMRAGASALVPKPYSPEELIGSLEKAMGEDDAGPSRE